MKKSLLCFGGPVLDRYLLIEDGKMEAYGFQKGQMALYDEPTPPEGIQRMFNDFPFTEPEFGGSAINTSKAYSLLGGKVGIACSYGDDDRRTIIENEAARVGATLYPCIYENSPTSYLMILVTPDAQRTVAGSFYPSFHLDSSRFDFSIIKKYDYTFVEAYSLSQDTKLDAIHKTVENIEKYNKNFVFALSNPFYVMSFKDQVSKIMNHKNCKIVIGNKDEYMALFSEFKTLEEVMRHIKDQKKWEIVVATDGAKGAWILHKDILLFSLSPEVANVVDTTGAGDYYSAGVLYALMNGYSLDTAARLSNMLAGDIISRVGCRLSDEVVEKAKKFLSSL